MKAKSLLYAVSAVFAVLSCSREAEETSFIETGSKVELVAAWADEENSGSRTAIQENGTSIWWTTGEEINAFFGAIAAGKFTSTNTEPVESATFSGTLNAFIGNIESVVQENACWAVYPYDAANTCDGESLTLTVSSEQVATEGTFADKFFPAVARANTFSLSFWNVCGGARFSVTQEGVQKVIFKSNDGSPMSGKVRVGFGDDNKPQILEILEPVDSIVVNAPEGGFVPGANYFAAMLPGEFPLGMTLCYAKTFTEGILNLNSITHVGRSVFGLLDGRDSTIPFMPKSAVKLSSNGYANCYIVDSPGAYSFSIGDDYFPINGNPFEAVVLWESFGTDIAPRVGDVINDVVFSNGKISFATSTELHNGNAVIALKDMDGTILWSWHIWVCESFDPNLTSQDYANGAGTMMDRNLGALSAEPGSPLAFGLFYQWGRKDPFLSAYSYNSSAPASSTANWPAAQVVNDANSYTIKNPMVFRLNGSASPDSNAWSTKKTVYDPCPPGWKVPDGGPDGIWSIAGITQSVVPYNSEYKGKFFDTNTPNIRAWYPAGGNLWGNVGPSRVYEISYGNAWWLSNTYSDNNMWAFVINKSENKDIQGMYNSGFYVRCQKEAMTYPGKTYEIPDAIDLGLSVKWASFNLGATKPEEYGEYFAWGEIEPKENYSWSTYKWCMNSSSLQLIKYCNNSSYGYNEFTDNKTVLDPEDDAAAIALGGGWRMPTKAEQDELRNSCTWTWTSKNGVNGRLVTGVNGNSIFLPAAGSRADTDLNGTGSYGGFWSSSLKADNQSLAYYVFFNSFNVDWYCDTDRYRGQCVRPVQDD